MSLDMLGIGNIISGVGKVADDLFTSDEERLKIALQEKSIEADLVKGQLEIDKAEAQHTSVFINLKFAQRFVCSLARLRERVGERETGWRPFIGWVGGIALAYQFILYPLMVWGWSLLQSHNWIPATLQPPPVLPAEQLWVILSGMLGIAGLRSFDKLKGTDTAQVGAPKAGN